jgi:hypothetical protein
LWVFTIPTINYYNQILYVITAYKILKNIPLYQDYTKLRKSGNISQYQKNHKMEDFY